MISFKAYTQTLFEGGALKGPNGEEADPISTKDRSKVRDDVGSSLEHLHNSFHEATGKHLFGKNAKAIRTGSAFSGSSAHLIDSTISNEELHKHKPTMGDIDTQVPKEHLSDLHKHLTPGKKFGKYTVVKAQKGGNEIHVLAKHENGQHHQIDFEGVEYHHEEPTKFETFAHSSHWEDTKNGVKGASHKQLLNAAGGETHKFSITHGLAPRTDDKKAPAVHGEKDPKEISKKLFGKEHPIDSFDDVAHGIKKHIDLSKHKAIVDKFAERGHPHAVERLKGILSGKKIDESVNIKIVAHKLAIDAIAKQIKDGTVDRKKALEKISEYKAKIKNLIGESFDEMHEVFLNSDSLELPELSHDEHKKLAIKHRDDYLDNHYNKGSTNTSAALKAKTLWHWHAMRGNKEINHGYFRDSDAFDNTRRKYLLSLKENYTPPDDRSKFGYTTTKKPKSTHSINCPWKYGHDCDCGLKSKTHANDCDWRSGHDCDCGLTESTDEGVIKNAIIGATMAGAIGYGTYKAAEADREAAKNNKTIAGVVHKQYQHAGGMSRGFNSKDSVIDGKPARTWSSRHKSSGTTHYYQFKDQNNESTDIMKMQHDIVLKAIAKHLVTGDTQSAHRLAKMHNIPLHTTVTTGPVMSKELATKLWGRNEAVQESHHAAVTLPMGTSPSSHVGHQDLVDEMLHHAPSEHSHVSLSDKAEYLSHAKRKEIMQKQSPEGVNVHVIHGAGESIRAAYDKLPAGKKVLHLVGGEERQGMLDRLKQGLEDGKVKEMEGHKFDEVHVHNPKVARRTTSNGDKTSGTNFRKALAAGDEKTIKDHLGKAYDPTLSKHLQKGVKSGAIEINRK